METTSEITTTPAADSTEQVVGPIIQEIKKSKPASPRATLKPSSHPTPKQTGNTDADEVRDADGAPKKQSVRPKPSPKPATPQSQGTSAQPAVNGKQEDGTGQTNGEMQDDKSITSKPQPAHLALADESQYTPDVVQPTAASGEKKEFKQPKQKPATKQLLQPVAAKEAGEQPQTPSNGEKKAAAQKPKAKAAKGRNAPAEDEEQEADSSESQGTQQRGTKKGIVIRPKAKAGEAGATGTAKKDTRRKGKPRGAYIGIPPKAGEMGTTRVLVNNQTAGVIIGKKGVNSASIREETGVFLTISTSDQTGGVGRIMTIQGTVTARAKALHLVAQIIEKNVEGMQGELSNEIQLLIHQNYAGVIIGKAGAIIKQIKSSSGAAVQISTECLAGSTEKICTVSGTPDQIFAAVSIVLQKIAEKPIRDGIQSVNYRAGDLGLGGAFSFNTTKAGAFGGLGPGASFNNTGNLLGGGFGNGFGGFGNSLSSGLGGGFSSGLSDGYLSNRLGGLSGSLGGGLGGLGGGLGSGLGGPGGGLGGGIGGGLGGSTGSVLGGGIGGGLGSLGTGSGGYADGFAGGLLNGLPGLPGGISGGFGGSSSGPLRLSGPVGLPLAGSKQTERVTIPAKSAGAVVGPGGSAIRSISAQTGCAISVSDADAFSPEIRTITVTGSAKQIQVALFLILQRVDSVGQTASSFPSAYPPYFPFPSLQAAVFPFDAICIEACKDARSQSLRLKRGERVKVTGSAQPGWIHGISYATQREGNFPAKNVKRVEQEPASELFNDGDARTASGTGYQMPRPPVDTAGEWVQTHRFKGTKSFGFYVCDCTKTWLSAHGFPHTGQSCQGCNKRSLPELMWRNDEYTREEADDRPVNLDGPHDCSRCQRCIEVECCIDMCFAGRRF